MEINVTAYFNNGLMPSNYSASIMEKGQNVGSITFNAAVEESKELMLLDTPEKVLDSQKHFESMGMSEEPLTWSDIETNATFIQLISGDIRECSEYLEQSPIDWKGYEADENNAGSLYQGIDNEIYYYLEY